MEFDVLSPDTKLEKKLVLEASAGTGKTFAIEHMVLRLLLEKKLFFPSIVILTFTKAATRELKRRIHSNMEKAICYLRQERKDFPYLIPWFAKKEEAIEILQQALSSFDQGMIFTIHGFCQRMLQEYPSAHGFCFPPIESKEKLISYVKEYFLQERISSLFSFEVDLFMHTYGKDWEGVIDLIMMHKIKDPLSLQEIGKKLFDLVHTLDKKRELSDHLDSFKKSKIDFPSLCEEVEIFSRLCERSDWDAFFSDFLQLCRKGLQLLSFFSLSNRKKKSDLVIPWWHDEVAPLLEKVNHLQRITDLIASDLQDKLYQFCLMHNLTTPDNLLLRMHTSVHVGNFAEEIAKRFSAAIIDEFQDTDSMQWEILSTLFNRPKHLFYLVGDPKQAIYGFRNADIYTYLQAKESMPKTAQLSHNFRSTAPLIEGINNLFSSLQFSLPQHKNNLSYQPLKAHKKGDSSTPAIHFFVASTPSSSKRWPSKEEEKKLFFPFIVQQLQKIDDLSQVAILVKDRYQGKEIQNYLQSHGIFSYWNNKKSLCDTLAAQALYDFFLATLSPFDESKIKRAFFGPYINLPLKELTDKDYLLFQELHQALKKDHFLFVRKFFALSFDGKTTILENMVAIEDLYEKTMAILELLFQEGSVINVVTLDHFFKSLKEKKSISLKSKEEGVEIVTIHMSKGLEYEIVFALGLYTRNKQKDNAFREEEEIDAEKERQLYVAMTRAKKKIYVPIAVDEKLKPIPKTAASPTELFLSQAIYNQPYAALVYEDVISYFCEKEKKLPITYTELPIPTEPTHKTKAQLAIQEPKISLKKQKEVQLCSYTSIHNKEVSLPNFSTETPACSGSDFGIFIHELLQKLLLMQENKKEYLEKRVKASIYHPYRQMIVEMVEKVLFSPIYSDIILSHLPLEQIFPEMVFQTGEEKERVWKGAIDLLFIHKQRYYLLDWKSNWLGDEKRDYETKAIEKVMDKEGYNLQANIYSKAVEKYLSQFENSYTFGGFFYIFLRGLKWNEGIYHFFPRGDDLCTIH